MADQDDVQVKVALVPDKKSEKETNQSFKNITSLIADLAIIGKVAGDALGKVWEAVKVSFDVGIQGFKTGVDALVKGFNVDEINKLAEALENIGGRREDAPKIASQIDEYIRGFQDPALRGEFIGKLFEALGRGGVDAALGDELVAALEAGDAFESLKLFGKIINEAGDKGSNLADEFGLGALGLLELNDQYSDFVKVLDNNSILYERNLRSLDQLNDAQSQLTTAFLAYRNVIAEQLAPSAERAAKLFTGFVENYVQEQRDIAQTTEDTKRFYSTDRFVADEAAGTSEAEANILNKLKEFDDNLTLIERLFPGLAISKFEQFKKDLGLNIDGYFGEVQEQVLEFARTPGNQLPENLSGNTTNNNASSVVQVGKIAENINITQNPDENAEEFAQRFTNELFNSLNSSTGFGDELK